MSSGAISPLSSIRCPTSSILLSFVSSLDFFFLRGASDLSVTVFGSAAAKIDFLYNRFYVHIIDFT